MSPMKRFALGLAAFTVVLAIVGLLVLPSADAHPKTRMRYCVGPTRNYPFNHIAHTNYGCRYPGTWVRVPWWVGVVV